MGMFHVNEDSSEYLRTMVEVEAKRIIKQCADDAKKLLDSNRRILKILADAILKYETMSGEEVTAVIESRRIETVGELRKKKKKEQEERAKLYKENRLVDL